jgi:hypothetical protein
MLTQVFSPLFPAEKLDRIKVKRILWDRREREAREKDKRERGQKERRKEGEGGREGEGIKLHDIRFFFLLHLLLLLFLLRLLLLVFFFPFGCVMPDLINNFEL